MGVTLPPKKAEKKPATEAEIDAIINKGGKTTQEAKAAAAPSDDEDDDTIKHMGMKLTKGLLREIDRLRALRPRKIGSPKLGISTHDWILEAILEKRDREQGEAAKKEKKSQK